MRMRDALRSWRDTPVLKVSSDPSDVESVTLRYLMYVLVPAWFVPGVLDWVMHRRTRIEEISALLCPHWDRVADWAAGPAPLRLRARRLPGGYLAAAAAGVAGLIAAPYGEELLRCARGSRRME